MAFKLSSDSQVLNSLWERIVLLDEQGSDNIRLLDPIRDIILDIIIRKPNISVPDLMDMRYDLTKSQDQSVLTNCRLKLVIIFDVLVMFYWQMLSSDSAKDLIESLDSTQPVHLDSVELDASRRHFAQRNIIVKATEDFNSYSYTIAKFKKNILKSMNTCISNSTPTSAKRRLTCSSRNYNLRSSSRILRRAYICKSRTKRRSKTRLDC